MTGVTAFSDLVSTDHVNNILDSLEDYQHQLEIFRKLGVCIKFFSKIYKLLSPGRSRISWLRWRPN